MFDGGFVKEVYNADCGVIKMRSVGPPLTPPLPCARPWKEENRRTAGFSALLYARCPKEQNLFLPQVFCDFCQYIFGLLKNGFVIEANDGNSMTFEVACSF